MRKFIHETNREESTKSAGSKEFVRAEERRPPYGLVTGLFLLVGIFFFAFSGIPYVKAAEELQRGVGASSGLSLPRFVSLASDEVRARTGPGLRYPVDWLYQQEGLPVEIVKEFENWRKVLDIDGQGGWVHKTLLSGRRTALINSASAVIMRESPMSDSKGVAFLEPELIVEIERCLDEWCRVRKADFSGWVERNFLWGIYEDEKIN